MALDAHNDMTAWLIPLRVKVCDDAWSRIEASVSVVV